MVLPPAFIVFCTDKRRCPYAKRVFHTSTCRNEAGGFELAI